MREDPFATLAEGYESWYETPLGAFVVAEEEKALETLLPPGEDLLEVGAGTGYWLKRLPYARKVGLEPSSAMLQVGRRKVPEATWVEGQGEALPFPEKSFDVVLLFTVLEFVEDVGKTLSEARRVLKPGGSLLVGILEALSPWAALYRRLGEKGVLPWAQARFLTREDLQDLLGPPEAEREAVFLAPEAEPPFPDADQAGLRAGNRGALYLGRWR
ncbi:class I SAM-dependent methyltransferase [Thermus tengchongensis]|uniref:Methyltransferase domain-containing protein n=1 Tax=Thermus tengchongensis TaxID=1214928 RepID=A0A4Y9FDV8_9DEIN|nr:methyltransferase domain-containing protein [Thermus tengchongensis]TFU27326.1 methyltransferase domain-containing protein [Thermus tengchongensis]